MKGEKMAQLIFLLIIGMMGGCVLGEEEEDEKCEIISNHTINGVEYRECKDGRLLKVSELSENDVLIGSEDVNLSEVGVISGDEQFLKDLSKTPKKESDAAFDAHFGKQREIREKVHSLQESLKKKKRSETAASKSQGRKFGVIYKHNGFDEGSVKHHDSDEESDEELEDEEAIGRSDAMIKATVGDSVASSTVVPALSLGDGINNTPEDVDVKELIALAHHKSYHKDSAKVVEKELKADSESLKADAAAASHPEIHQPHDALHFGNLRFLDFAPEGKKEEEEAKPSTTTDASESMLLPETPNNNNNNNNNNQQPLPPNPYFLALANNPVKVQSVEQSAQEDSGNIFNDVRKVFASATPTSDFARRHDDGTNTATYYFSMIKPQIILAFLAPITAFLIYCTIVLFYIYRKKSSSKRKLLPTKNCRYQHFNEDAEATVGFAV